MIYINFKARKIPRSITSEDFLCCLPLGMQFSFDLLQPSVFIIKPRLHAQLRGFLDTRFDCLEPFTGKIPRAQPGTRMHEKAADAGSVHFPDLTAEFRNIQTVIPTPERNRPEISRRIFITHFLSPLLVKNSAPLQIPPNFLYASAAPVKMNIFSYSSCHPQRTDSHTERQAGTFLLFRGQTERRRLHGIFSSGAERQSPLLPPAFRRMMRTASAVLYKTL